MMPAGFGRSLSVIELLDELADALAWPRNRPARVVLGDRAASVGEIALCVSDAALDDLSEDPGVAVVLLTPPSTQLARRGRRTHDVFDGQAAHDWSRSERVVIDASEMLAGGSHGLDELAAADAGLHATVPLDPVDRDEYRFVGFVPEEALERVRHAVFSAGAGVIGEYAECSWSTIGTGTFRGGSDSAPTVGTAGSFEQVPELRFETVCPGHLRTVVAHAFVAAHPYEEPAYEFVALGTPAAVGLGRVGVAEGARHAVATGPLSHVLPALLRESPGIVSVMCSGAVTVAERALLADRGIALQQIEAANLLPALAPALAARLSRVLGRKVQFVAPLAFPQKVGDVPATGAAVQAGSWRLYFDGGSRGNPGPAAAAFVLYDPSGVEVLRWHQVLGTATNNIAEYNGVLNGLRHAVELGIEDLQVFGDSELIVKQLLGKYKVKNEGMKPLHAEASALLRRIPRYSVQHVYRTDNAVADALVNEALDAQRA